MARKKRTTKVLPLIDDVEGALDNMMTSVEDWAKTLALWLQGILKWLRKHKKLAVVVLIVIFGYNYLLNNPRNKDEDDDEDDDEYED